LVQNDWFLAVHSLFFSGGTKVVQGGAVWLLLLLQHSDCQCVSQPLSQPVSECDCTRMAAKKLWIWI